MQQGKKKELPDADDINEAPLSEQMKCSLRLGSALWSLNGTAWSDEVIGVHGHCPSARKDPSQSTKPTRKPNVKIEGTVYTRMGNQLLHGPNDFSKKKSVLMRNNSHTYTT